MADYGAGREPLSIPVQTEIKELLRNAAVLVNPSAGSGRARTEIARVRSLLEEAGIRVEFAEARSASELRSATRRLLEQGRKTLIALGGDGTAQLVVQESLGRDVVIGILPAGGGNDFAAALGMPKETKRAAKAMLQGRIRQVDLASARTADGMERIYLGGGGIGLDAESALAASTHFRKRTGKARYVSAALHAFRKVKPMRVKITCDEETPEEKELILASVLNTPTFGSGVRLAPEARIDDGFLEAVFLPKISAVQLARALPGLAVLGEVRLPNIERRRVKKLRLETETPQTFHGDGEIFGKTPVEIRVLEQAIRVIAAQ